MNMTLKGNKGEWSELYTFFKLLHDGILFSADEKLNKTKSSLDVNSIFRDDTGKELEFKRSANNLIDIIDVVTNTTIMSFNYNEAKTLACELLNEINKLKGNSNTIQLSTEQKIKKYHISQVKTKSQDKGDIRMLVYDSVHGFTSEQHFSIKSFLGSDPTLFNANKTTNIIFQITDKSGNSISKNDFTTVNQIKSRFKYIDRVQKIQSLGYEIEFDSYEDSTFKLNLQLIDSDLPKMLAYVVLDKYVSKITKIPDIINKLNRTNPLKYDLSQGHNFYEYRLINFLVEAALGMTSKKVWTGQYAVIGGLIIVKTNADIVCYHLVDFNKFKQYLKNTCKLDNPSGSKMGYGEVYYENNKSYIKLNFQFKA